MSQGVNMVSLKVRYSLFAAALLLLAACGSKKKATEETAAAKEPEPQFVTVQHILIGFEGTIPGKPVTRTREDAQALAEKIFQRAKAGEDFGELVRQYTDDAYPGIYKMANFGVKDDPSRGIFERAHMVAAFGDVGFPLAVGAIGMAAYDPQKSPYGWHIIKRIE
jgi:hypothetical protein